MKQEEVPALFDDKSLSLKMMHAMEETENTVDVGLFGTIARASSTWR